MLALFKFHFVFLFVFVCLIVCLIVCLSACLSVSLAVFLFVWYNCGCVCWMAGVHRRGFSIHFTNVRGLFSNLASVEYHLSHSHPNLLLLSEPQISKNSSSNFFNISNYNLFHNFPSKGGVCAYVNTNTPVTRLVNLESPNFDVLWLKIFLPTATIILCFYYCSTNITDFSTFPLLLTRLLHLHIQILKSSI